MSLIPITLFGDKILRKKVAKVTEINGNTIKIISDMFETMRNAKGIGLAANQVGVNQQIFVVDLSWVEGYESYKPIALINPKIVAKSDEQVIIEEGCLSIPELRAEITRPEMINISFFDTDMKEQTIEADELFARVMLHEYDHLQGVLFIDYLVEEMKKRSKKHLARIKKRKLEIDYPVSDNIDYMLIK
ncbi:MAG TPA: peptide deformylase [Ignavibacteriaceae bacterium]|jgi:peptide deformylase|nr:MAG: Peptide deformylase [Ignavibacteria bacterium ADurb.Bin266]OQY72886.1 MAG: peptide deformylase [Ignavibacteriales bacterium UTCHB2]HQF42031.1 peptide deformylase [Ignavibacteriaceae bacterium]HQI42153.1 peptide deformylase [Ignavibacteriaceae bacterium]